MEQVLDLGAVGPDVLDRRGAHRARDQRHVLQPAQALRQGELHEVVPVFAGAGPHQDGVRGLTDDFLAGQGHVQHQQLDFIVRDQEIAAAAQHQARQGGKYRVGGQRLQLRRVLDAQVAPRARGNAEGIELLEGNVVFDGEGLHGWVRSWPGDYRGKQAP